MNEAESLNFQVDWRKRYIAALEEKLKLLKKICDPQLQKPENPELLLQRMNHEIEAMELEHKITYAKIALNDWVVRVKEYDARFAADVKRAKENIDKYIAIAEKSTFPRIVDLLKKFNTVNRHNDEQINIFYKSLEVELKNQKLV